MKCHRIPMLSPVAGLFVAGLLACSPLQAADPEMTVDDGDELLIEDDGSVVIDDDTPAGDEPVLLDADDSEDGQNAKTPGAAGDEVAGPEEVDDEEPLLIEDEDATAEVLELEDENGDATDIATTAGSVAGGNGSGFSLKLDELWAEYGHFTRTNPIADDQGYLFAKATARWLPAPQWEVQMSARLDGLYQSGGADWDRSRLDYAETFLRYRTEGYRLTLGADKVIWGRIDELPPSDRFSTWDLSRYILDDLPDRRRATPMVRLERFFAAGKLDLIYLPLFRGAVLPGEESVWYPVDRTAGRIIGLPSTPAMSALIRNSAFDTEVPDSDGGFAMRFSASNAAFDYGLTLQKTRQSAPYFRFDATTGVFRAEYPRSWAVGGDIAVEAAGATWRLEGVWLSDTPATRLDGRYTTVESINWGAAVEFYPGDGDTRVNIQLTGSNMINAPDVLDRTAIYSINGSVETPFAHNRWRAKTRFFVGLGENDIYINPEIAYIGWEPHEIYLEGHYFQGGDGTPGGFHEDHSLLTLGWRVRF